MNDRISSEDTKDTSTQNNFANINNSNSKKPYEYARSKKIIQWAKINNVDIENLRQGKNVSSFIHHDYHRVNTKNKDQVSLKDVEYLFEDIVSSNQKTNKGSFYTPDYIINYIVRECLNLIEGRGIADPTVCDHACGSGGFLIGAVEELKDRLEKPLDKIVEENIYGIDIDSNAIKHAKALIEMYLALNDVSLPVEKFNFYNADSLLTSAKEIKDRLNVPEGFDLIVTNPPYVKLQNLETDYRQKLSDTYSNFVRGSFGLSPLFMVSGVRLLSEDGQLGVITQNNIFTSLAGKNIRDYLQSKKLIDKILDFGHNKVFKNASTYTCIILASNEDNNSFEYDYIESGPIYKKINECNFYEIDFGRISPEKWRLAKGVHFDNLHKIEAVGKALGDVAQIKVGYATLNDKVFSVFEKGDICISRDGNDNEMEVEKEITRKSVKISEIECKEDIARSNRRVIFPYRKVGGKYKLIDESEMKGQYPKAYNYLSANKDDLRKTEGDPEWYAWGRRQCMDAPGPKLLTKTFNSKPSFYLDNSDSLFCNGYGLWINEGTLFSSDISIKVLKKILDSAVMHYYAKLTSFQIDGDYQCYQKNFIERFGIPSLSERENQLIESGNKKEVDSLLFSKYNLNRSDVMSIIQ